MTLAAAAHGDGCGGGMGAGFGAVIEGRKLHFRAVTMAEGKVDEFVGERRVLGQDRPVEVGANGVAVAGTLGAIAGVVAEAADHPAERLGSRAEKGATTVVFESDDLAAVSRKDHIADAAVGSRAGVTGFEVEDADAGDDAALMVDVAMAKELKATTDGEDGHVSFDGLADGGAFFHQVGGDATLFAVLPAADEEEIEVIRRKWVANGHVDHLAFDTTDAATVLEGDDVAAVAVDVHDVGIQMGDAKFHLPSVPVHLARGHPAAGCCGAGCPPIIIWSTWGEGFRSWQSRFVSP